MGMVIPVVLVVAVMALVTVFWVLPAAVMVVVMGISVHGIGLSWLRLLF
jgi:hypothetical protein